MQWPIPVHVFAVQSVLWASFGTQNLSDVQELFHSGGAQLPMLSQCINSHNVSINTLYSLRICNYPSPDKHVGLRPANSLKLLLQLTSFESFISTPDGFYRKRHSQYVDLACEDLTELEAAREQLAKNSGLSI